MDLNGFDATAVAERQSFETLPNGDYTATITESENKPTKKGDGERLKLTFEIIEGQHKGRKLWTGLNMKNPSAVAVEISMSELGEICKAVNVLRPQQSNQLHNIPLIITIAAVKDDHNGGLKNEIKRYKPLSQATSKPAANTTGQPWAR
jgi:hypothetical protein